MSIGEWIGSSLGFIVAMLGAMSVGVGLVVYAALGTMRVYVADEALEASPAAAVDHQQCRPPVPAPVLPASSEPMAVRLAG